MKYNRYRARRETASHADYNVITTFTFYTVRLVFFSYFSAVPIRINTHTHTTHPYRLCATYARFTAEPSIAHGVVYVTRSRVRVNNARPTTMTKPRSGAASRRATGSAQFACRIYRPCASATAYRRRFCR